MSRPGSISVLCVDDNPHVTRALESKLHRSGKFDWRGSLSSADQLVETVARECPEIVLLDVDMPGMDPLAALERLSRECPNTRTVVFSGHIRRELVERAVESGAWGYVSKNDDEAELIRAIRSVAEGEFVLSVEARRVFGD